MILADKIIDLRKKNDWSQEELAEKLDVSRQAISKWESAQSVPDLSRVIRMAELKEAMELYFALQMLACDYGIGYNNAIIAKSFFGFLSVPFIDLPLIALCTLFRGFDKTSKQPAEQPHNDHSSLLSSSNITRTEGECLVSFLIDRSSALSFAIRRLRSEARSASLVF